MPTTPVTTRVDGAHLRVDAGQGFPAHLYARDDVPVDRAGFRELTTLLGLEDTIADLDRRGAFGAPGAAIERAALTPDFHKGAGIPVGTVLSTRSFVLPKAIGNDVGCGMRMAALPVKADDVRCLGRDLDDALRRRFFQGGRDLPTNRADQRTFLEHGLAGVPVAGGGFWSTLNADRLLNDRARTHETGLRAGTAGDPFGDWIRRAGDSSRDDTTGTIGGDNHFVEIQEVAEIVNHKAAGTLGLRSGDAVVMVHSGSLGIGSLIGGLGIDLARSIWPDGVGVPDRFNFAHPSERLPKTFQRTGQTLSPRLRLVVYVQ